MKYTFKQEERSFPVDFKELAKKVKRFAKQDDELIMTLDFTNLIAFQCHGIHFCQKSAEDELEPTLEPQIGFKIACTTGLADFLEVLKFASDHTDYACLNANHALKVEGDCSDDETLFYKKLKIKLLRDGPPAKNLYSLEYLLAILNIATTKYLDRQGVLLELTHNMPLRITLPLSSTSFSRSMSQIVSKRRRSKRKNLKGC